MAIARSLAIKASNPALSALARINAERRMAKQANLSDSAKRAAVNEALAAFVLGISNAARTAALQLEQATAARRNDGMPVADDQLSGASLWSLIADSGRGAKQKSKHAARDGNHADVLDGMQLDCDAPDDAEGADATWFVSVPNVAFAIDENNAERSTLYVVGSASIAGQDDYGRDHVAKVYVSLKRETERDGLPIVAHVDPASIPHFVLLSACERIARKANADGTRCIPERMYLWCSVGRWAGRSDAPGMAYSGWSWLAYNRAIEQERKRKARGNKRAPLHTTDVSRVRTCNVVASQHTESARMSELAADWYIGRELDPMTWSADATIAELAERDADATCNGPVRNVNVQERANNAARCFAMVSRSML